MSTKTLFANSYVWLLLLVSASLSGQIIIQEPHPYNDLKLWMGLQYQHDFNKSWRLKSTLQTRLHQHITLLQRNLIEVEGLYSPRQTKFLKAFRLGLGFRVFGVNDTKGSKQGLRMGFRTYGLIQYQQDWKRWKWSYRLQYQDQRGIPRQYLSETAWQRQHVLRNRLKIGYNFKNWKLDPELQAEIFYQFNAGQLQGFNALRLGLGTRYKISKQHQIKLRLLYERSIQSCCPQNDFVLVLNYKFSTKTKKKKKKKHKK